MAQPLSQVGQRQHQLDISGIRREVRTETIDRLPFIDLIGFSHLTALLAMRIVQNLSQVLNGEPSLSKLSFQQKSGHPPSQSRGVQYLPSGIRRGWRKASA